MHILFSLLVGVTGSASLWAEDWGKIIDASGGARVQFGTEIDAAPAFSRNETVPFAPASNSKFFTANAALEKFGPDYGYPTELVWEDQGDGTALSVKLVGHGDPSWGLGELNEKLTTRIDQIAQAFADQGIKQINGDIQVVPADERWNTLRYPEGWTAGDSVQCDGALGQAFNLDINCGTFVLSSPTAGFWSEAGLREPVQIQVTTAKTTHLSAELLDFNHPAQGFVIRGTLKKGAHPGLVLPLFHVDDWVKNLLTQSLLSRGVHVLPSTPSVLPHHPKQLNFVSPSLSLIVKAMMKNSINVIGDAIFKTLAVAFGNPAGTDLVQVAQATLQDFLLTSGIPAEFKLFDGAGLSRVSQITPRAMLAFLNHAKQVPSFTALWDALPIAGVDGTLRNRMRGTSAFNYLRAKTGTLDGVYNLSGYVPFNGAFVSFVMLTRTSTSEIGVARAAEDRVGAALSTQARAAVPVKLTELEPFPYIPEHAGREDVD